MEDLPDLDIGPEPDASLTHVDVIDGGTRQAVTTDARAGRLEAIRAAMAEGLYRVDSTLLADKLIQGMSGDNKAGDRDEVVTVETHD